MALQQPDWRYWRCFSRWCLGVRTTTRSDFFKSQYVHAYERSFDCFSFADKTRLCSRVGSPATRLVTLAPPCSVAPWCTHKSRHSTFLSVEFFLFILFILFFIFRFYAFVSFGHTYSTRFFRIDGWDFFLSEKVDYQGVILFALQSKHDSN